MHRVRNTETTRTEEAVECCQRLAIGTTQALSAIASVAARMCFGSDARSKGSLSSSSSLSFLSASTSTMKRILFRDCGEELYCR